MKLERIIRTVDLHLGGESYRYITEGIPPLRGTTMEEKMKYMKNNYDHLRTAVMRPPRGYRDMFGGVITEPVSDNADCGIFYMGAITEDTYYPMCGTGTIALATMLVNTGRVTVQEPYTEVIVDTAIGQVKSNVKVRDGKAVEVTFTNVPAFICKKNVEITTEAFGSFSVDIGYGGGSFCALIDMDKINCDLERDQIDEMIKPALKIINKLKEEVDCRHPESEDINSIDSCMYCDWVDDAGRELLVLGSGLIGRCPSGTGTPIRMAREYERGNLELGEEFVQKSMIGTSLTGKLVKETLLGNQKAYVAEVTGSAYMTGLHEFFIESDDPLKEGYIL